MWKVARLLAMGVLPLAATFPVGAQMPALTMLEPLARGAWELRSRSDGSTRRICLRSGQEFIQLRHAQQGCEFFVIQDEPKMATVQYTCRGAGFGRTSVRSEDRHLVQIRSEGIHIREPFSIDGEARHVGRC